MTAYGWHQRAVDFIETYGVPPEIAEAAAEHPTSVTLDPRSSEVGYPVEARRRGDVTAIVGYRDPAAPTILYVRVHLPDEQHASGTGGGNGGSGSVAPRTMRGLRARIVADGFRIEAGGRHLRVLTPEGEYLMSLPVTPSDHRAVPNGWAGYRKARDRYRVRQVALRAG